MNFCEIFKSGKRWDKKRLDSEDDPDADRNPGILFAFFDIAMKITLLL